MSNVYMQTRKYVFKVITSWYESVAFLSNRKLFKAFILVSFKALVGMMHSLLGLLLVIWIYTGFKFFSLEQANATFTGSVDKGILFNVCFILVCAALSGLRPSIIIKDRGYYLNCFIRLIPVVLLAFGAYSIFSFYTDSSYMLIYSTIGSPLLCVYILFLLDSKAVYNSLLVAGKKAFVFCILNAPALAILYGLLGLALGIFYVITGYITQPIIALLVCLCGVMSLFFPYWSLLSTLYVKRMHDQLEYYI